MGHTRETRGGDADLLTQVTDLQQELDGLRRALRTRATIEQAMGVLVATRRCPPQDAFKILVRLSQQHNIKLHRIAQALVELAQRVEQAQLDPLLHEAATNGTLPGDADGDGTVSANASDDAVLRQAHVLASASDDDVDDTLTALYQVLVDHGWVPPHDVLSRLRVRA
ncbi:ANTAR domain-containing protein [Prauserella cavernicola]|uniref:ANTAR domain-containing protein n=1 Tax=Prauserella cavernicola TaxID=2800127 RepID=A0A934QU50_9PSEU|nr:ANTAR domain-containing protein [Prauserella cavernicola]MBK1786480.1 ANTAR domain-containing protein [Prauserella cavernicola]